MGERSRAAEAVIENGEIVIRLPVENLDTAVLYGPETDGVKVTDLSVFAAAVVNELNFEDEVGNTPVKSMFDRAFGKAIDNGCEGVELPESPR